MFTGVFKLNMDSGSGHSKNIRRHGKAPDTRVSGGVRQSRAMNKIIAWFEIPALQIERARAFYQQILQLELRVEAIGPNTLAVFPYDRESATGGCLMAGEHYRPSTDGATVYLNAGNELNTVLARVAAAGGKVLLPRTELPPGMGAFAHILDTEGNRVGLFGN